MKAEAATYAGMAFALTVLVACSGVPNAATSRGASDPAMGVINDPASTGGEQKGYLTPATTPDASQIIPPAPKEGEARNDADWSIFRATRVYEGSDRWKLAINDDSYKPEDLLKDFSCSVDAQLTVAKAPTLAKILARVGTDASNAAASAKNLYKRTRPFLHNPGNICIERSEGLVKSFDYPSGHSSASWVEGLVLAELAPDRATRVLQRARGYGESRIVCGVHNWSAVEGGRTNGASVFAALHSSPEFRADMARAREELDTARKSGAKPDATACAKEAELTKPLPVK
ncbi:MAG TPA: phosphatase PAP2 family protein [Hyphomonadaceae bacterium]|jgi:acid phosphatase (class A)|nr:phosphatase PAP2 family protein [Hyphomonadaceae bacterium]